MSQMIDEYLDPNMMRIRWTRIQADRATQHLVYIFWSAEDMPLYIGRSCRGIMRPLDPAHRTAVMARKEADHIEFIICDDPGQAERIEKRLIYQLRPQYNVRGKTLTNRAKPVKEQELTQTDIDHIRWLRRLGSPV